MKKKLLLGLGRSNLSIIKYFVKHEIDFDVFDDNYNAEFDEFAKTNKINYCHSKKFKAQELDKYDLVIKTPGIDPRHNVLFYARKENIKIITEINYALELFTGKVVAITGTNGKSTTTHLIYSILKSQNIDAYLVGNFGNPIMDIIEQTTNESVLVLELSSFQLHYLKEIKPDIAVFTNISEDHLEWHVGFDNYVKDKSNIFKNMDINDDLIINFDDELLKQHAFQSLANIVPVSQKQKLFKGAYVSENNITIGDNIFDPRQLHIQGLHNYTNLAMALLVGEKFNLDPKTMFEFAKKYDGLEHRMQKILDSPIQVFNDSKATNIDSMNTAIASMQKEFILIIGGKAKKENLENIKWNPLCTFVYLYGEDGLYFEKYLVENDVNYRYIENFQEVVKHALTLSNQTMSDLLLSPACASFDQHASFEVRGEEFKKIVEEYTWKF